MSQCISAARVRDVIRCNGEVFFVSSIKKDQFLSYVTHLAHLFPLWLIVSLPSVCVCVGCERFVVYASDECGIVASVPLLCGGHRSFAAAVDGIRRVPVSARTVRPWSQQQQQQQQQQWASSSGDGRGVHVSSRKAPPHRVRVSVVRGCPFGGCVVQ